jgi:hypothetical protein
LLILHFLMSVCTQFHHLFLGRPLGRLPWGLLLNTWLTVLLRKGQLMDSKLKSFVFNNKHGFATLLRYPSCQVWYWGNISQAGNYSRL